MLRSPTAIRIRRGVARRADRVLGRLRLVAPRNTPVTAGEVHQFVGDDTAGAPLHLLIGDTGIASPTRLAVADVRRQWQAEPERFNLIFDRCGACALAGREAIEQGNVAALGPLMAENHQALQEMTVSSPELDLLVEVALEAGSLGAKLSGGGRGGNMIALVEPDSAADISERLLAAGASRVLQTRLESPKTAR